MHRHEFTCDECGQHIVHKSDLTTGYAIDGQNRKICYECSADIDRQSMVETGHSRHLPLYLTISDGKHEVTNWPGTLRFRATHHRTGRHNLGGTRTDVWFVGPDGYIWHGVQISEQSQVCHCKRTKYRAEAAPRRPRPRRCCYQPEVNHHSSQIGEAHARHH